MTTIVTYGLLAFLTFPWAAIAQAADAAYQGFGATTPGGSGGKVVHVTNLNDSGPGSLREAVSKGNRTVVFDVGGEIVLASHLFVRGAFITIDGFTAPPPGITLKNRGLIIRGTRGAHDVIVRGIRVRNSPIDGIQVSYGAYNVVIDHVSIHGSGDGNLDITDSHDVTVSWSVLAEPAGSEKNMLIKYDPSRITLHHNIFVKARQRNPQVRIDDPGTPATDTTIDMRNNVVWDWDGGYGTLIWYGPRANIVDNFYSSAGGDAKDALTVCKGDCNGGDPASLARAYVAGNFSGDGLTTINDVGNEGIPFPAPLVDTLNACLAAHWVLSEAGLRPLDLLDQQYLSVISLPSCEDSTASPDLIVSSLSLPSKAGAGSTISVTDTTKNQGAASAETSTIKFYLSTDTAYGAGDILLGSRAISSLAPEATSSGSTFVTIPAGTTTGTYYLIAKAGTNKMALGANNTNYKPIKIGPDLIVSSLSLPSKARAGSTITVSSTIKNRGGGRAGDFTIKFYLSTNTTYDAGDVLLGSRIVSSLAPGAKSSGSTVVTVPSDTTPGTYYIIAMADAEEVLLETNEGNNAKFKRKATTIY